MLAAAGVDTVDLLGGEPTLHPQLDGAGGALAARGMRTTLSTNGRGDLALLERLEEPLRARGAAGRRLGERPRASRRACASYIARRSPMLKSVCTRDWRVPPVGGGAPARGRAPSTS